MTVFGQRLHPGYPLTCLLCEASQWAGCEVIPLVAIIIPQLIKWMAAAAATRGSTCVNRPNLSFSLPIWRVLNSQHSAHRPEPNAHSQQYLISYSVSILIFSTVMSKSGVQYLITFPSRRPQSTTGFNPLEKLSHTRYRTQRNFQCFTKCYCPQIYSPFFSKSLIVKGNLNLHKNNLRKCLPQQVSSPFAQN